MNRPLIVWDRVLPSGAWRVTDERLRDAGLMRTRVYLGYSRRDARAEHAAYVRTLKSSRKAA